MNVKQHLHFYSVLGLVIISFSWGFGFVALDWCGRLPGFMIMAIRFSMAAVLLAVIFCRHLKYIDKSLVKAGIIIGLYMFLCYACASFGIRFTTTSRTAFFSCLGAICVPMLNFVFFKIKMTRKAVFCVILCLVGVYSISMGGTTDLGFNFGDMLCLFASVFGAAQSIAVERMSKKHDIFALSIVELAAITVLSVLMSLITGETYPGGITPLEIGALLFIGVVCSALCFVLQMACLKHVPADRASLILTLEPVVGAAASVLLLGDVLGVFGILGGALIVVSIIMSELSAGAEIPAKTDADGTSKTATEDTPKTGAQDTPKTAAKS